MDIKDAFNLFQEKKDLEEKLFQISKKCENVLENCINKYFGGKIPQYIPLKKNQFISVNHRSFKLEKGEKGKIFWVATGRLITIKDGNVTHGHSFKTLYQGEYEALPEAIKESTIESSKESSKSIFPIVPKVYNGSDFANYGYELASNKELGLILAWRKGATAYINRSSGSVTSEASLQLLVNQKMNRTDIINKLKDFYNSPTTSDTTKKLVDKVCGIGYVDIVSGGRLNKNIILKNQEVISEIFGQDAVNDIITKLQDKKAHKNSEVKESSIYGDGAVPSSQLDWNSSEIKETDINGKKMKI